MFYESSLKSCGQNCLDIIAFEYSMNLPRIPIQLLASDSFSAMDISFSMQATVARCGYEIRNEDCAIVIDGIILALVKPRDHVIQYGPSASVIFQSSHIESGSYFLFCTTMSDLDADLYGGEFNGFATGDTSSHGLDLYGNDGAEEQPQEENDIQQQPLPEAPTESPPSASIPTEQASSKLSNIETVQPNGMTPQAPSSNGALASQYIQQQAPQKIPTYEEPQPSEYREPQQVRSDGVYQNIPVNERSIRPSEMKDEG